MRLEGVVGPQVLQDGAVADVRLGKVGATVVTELHGKYYEENYRGNIYHATMTAGVLLPAAASTANQPMTLANPAGSGKNLVLVSFDMGLTTINATAATGVYGLYVNTNVVAAAVTGTVITPIPGMVGTNNQPVAKAFSTSTLPVAPTLLKLVGYKLTGGAASAASIFGLPVFHLEFDGTVILTPGSAITPQLSAADSTNATVICSFAWEEIVV